MTSNYLIHLEITGLKINTIHSCLLTQQKKIKGNKIKGNKIKGNKIKGNKIKALSFYSDHG